MNLAHVRERLSNGFRPSVVELTNGRRFEVPHPESIMVIIRITARRPRGIYERTRARKSAACPQWVAIPIATPHSLADSA
jgi:hypothetical protein